MSEYTESNHPVLQKLKEEIAAEQAQVQRWKDMYSDVSNRYGALQERIKNVLTEAMDNELDVETIEWIARNLDVDLTRSKQIEVTVCFTIDVTHPITMTDVDDIVSDLQYSVDTYCGDVEVIDYSCDVVRSEEL
jgi:chromosome segregation ATPase